MISLFSVERGWVIGDVVPKFCFGGDFEVGSLLGEAVRKRLTPIYAESIVDLIECELVVVPFEGEREQPLGHVVGVCP